MLTLSWLFRSFRFFNSVQVKFWSWNLSIEGLKKRNCWTKTKFKLDEESGSWVQCQNEDQIVKNDIFSTIHRSVKNLGSVGKFLNVQHYIVIDYNIFLVSKLKLRNTFWSPQANRSLWCDSIWAQRIRRTFTVQFTRKILFIYLWSSK